MKIDTLVNFSSCLYLNLFLLKSKPISHEFLKFSSKDL